MGKKHHRQFTKDEIIAQCTAIARQRRTADRSPWTAINIVTAYSLMTTEGFRGKKIQSILGPVSDKFILYTSGQLDLKSYSDRLMDKVGWTIEYEKYTQADVRGKKGTYAYWINSKQLDPVNSINDQCTAFLVLFFNQLMDIGYGQTRLTRVRDSVSQLFKNYEENKETLTQWRQELMNVAGIAFENPRDPLYN